MCSLQAETIHIGYIRKLKPLQYNYRTRIIESIILSGFSTYYRYR